MDYYISRVKPLNQGYSVDDKESEVGICKECGKSNSFGDDWSTWCTPCNSRHFIDEFHSWTSGNDNIDRLIRETQIKASHYEAVFEWIPYSQFANIVFINKGGYGEVYKAEWLHGPVLRWDREKKRWFRWPRVPVALKTLYNSQNISSEFLSEITSHLKLYKSSNTCSEIVRCHGISQNPVTKEYIMVLEYCARGDLARYNEKNSNSLTWSKRLDHLLDIAHGLNTIHSEGLMHRDIHSGNLLIDVNYAAIGDLGLCRPANSSVSKNVYGVMPYIAPEVLRGKPFTQVADIYSFGIIMWELSSNHRPFPDIPHDLKLALRICRGVRPEIVEGTPECYKELMQKCWHSDPSERPNITNIVKCIEKWLSGVENDDSVWSEADRNRKSQSLLIEKPLVIKTHPQAVYTSRLLPMVTHELICGQNRDDLTCNRSQASCDECIININHFKSH